jgi:hypothetical protein
LDGASANLVAMPGHFKQELVNAIRMRQVEQRSLSAHWSNDHCTSSPSGVRHCRDGEL